ncbi:MAG: sulfatase/phosphatase domain-containing protein [Luteolibacter sp.]
MNLLAKGRIPLQSILRLLPLFLSVQLLSAAERPNIVFIFSDDHALNSISAYGGPLKNVAPTPNLDRIAGEGAIFTNSFCSNSICGPSRAAILTGKHSHVNGYVDNNTSRFDGSQTTFPKLLQKAGYETAIIGKWHLVSDPQGFDHWEILPGQGSYYNPDFLQQDGGKKRYQGYVTDIVTDRAIDWLGKERDADKPFVLMCQHKAPHRNWSPALRHTTLFDGVKIPGPASLFDDYSNRSKTLGEQEMSIAKHMFWANDMKFHGENLFPKDFMGGLVNNEYERMDEAQKKAWDAAYEPRNKEFIDAVESGELEGDAITSWKYQRYIKDYLRCIRAVDENVGRLLDYLDESGLAENTIVIYSSDQGFYLGEHGWYDKRWMFEESLAMPFLVRWPGVIKPGTRNAALIQNIDYAPTFLEVAGVEVPATVQGKSLVPLFQSSAEPEGWREGIYYFYSGEATHHVAAHDGVRNKRYKLMHFPDTEEWNLFDLEKDPGEMKSVHQDPEYKQVIADMKELYSALRSEYRMSAATVPTNRNSQKWWKERHKAKVAEAAQGGHELVFIGDSITQGFENAGKEAWQEITKGRKALNLGFSGDRTQDVLWRLMNGELEGTDPELFVLMIGTNNTGHNQAPAVETADGIRLIVELLRDRKPDAEILLLSVFPRGENPEDPLRKINDGINDIIKDLADGEKIHWLDMSDVFLDENGVLPKAIMPDSLHPKEEGYRLWAETMTPEIERLLK